MRRIFESIIGSLPIWAGVIVIILSFILWDAQRNEQADDLHAIIALQSKHVSQLVYRENQDGYINRAALQDDLSKEHYSGFSIELRQKGKVIFEHGLDVPYLKNKWSDISTLDLNGHPTKLIVWPEKGYLHARFSYLPFVAFTMGIIVGILLIIVGFLAHIASRRAAAIISANRRVREQVREKEKLQKVLQHNQKLQAIGTLAGGIAHDFNNILYAIMGYVSMAREDVPEDSLVHTNLGKVLKAGERGKKLIASILSFSRQHASREMRRLNLVEMLDHVFDLLVPGLPEKIQFDRDVAVKNAWIVGDMPSLEQVVINIANNAVDAMNQEGGLTIGLHRDDHQKSYNLVIKDNGPGMSSEVKQRIFEPFFTTKSVGNGTGLGLSMAHGIVEQHQGKIEVDSTQGQGTTFIISLPMANET